ncbi:ABC transporter ATP-binding protein/permease [Selenomonadales bacterium OttesenSCG-928-I06]|nr:ABC transporter ATP-binding protein/permease [Selenomonadales bacterium OttesenSCG-928-I06]
MSKWTELFKTTLRLIKGYWTSEQKLTAWGLLLIIVALNLVAVFILVLINKWYNDFYSALQNYDADATFIYLLHFTGLAFCHIIVGVYKLYLRQMLQIKWRNFLTGAYLNRWLKNKNYYIMQVLKTDTDNPDQRISEDLNLFTNMTLVLSLGLLSAVVTLVSFVFILWDLSGVITIPTTTITIPGYMVWAAIIYAVAGTYFAHYIGKPLIKLNFDQQRYEADFRFSLVRLRENSESVAFYKGEKLENQNFLRRFSNVIDNFWKIMKRQKKLTWFTSGYSQLAIIFPFVVASPRYFAKELTLGGLMQVASAFGRVQDSLSFFVEAYTSLAEWKAVVNRLSGFVLDMDKSERVVIKDKLKIVQKDNSAEELSLNNLSIKLPNNDVLLKDVNFTVKKGESILITGASGAGKSTFLRTLAGLWPYAEGTINLPPNYNALFVPQKPYLPLGTLREVLLYPSFEHSNNEITDDKIREIMTLCHLEEFYHLLDKTDDWSRILSLGEQQRVAFARIFLKEPDWIFLDEATSALDEDTEKHLYAHLSKKLTNTTIVSVGHRSSIIPYHQKKVLLENKNLVFIK